MNVGIIIIFTMANKSVCIFTNYYEILLFSLIKIEISEWDFSKYISV